MYRRSEEGKQEMFNPDNNYEKFENKVWLSSPTMYLDSMCYVMEAYETNWMSTVGEM